jgi:hypothetical protein
MNIENIKCFETGHTTAWTISPYSMEITVKIDVSYNITCININWIGLH